MNYRLLYFKITVFIGLIFFNSCTKDVDFDQANDLELYPVIESSVIYFDSDASRFYNNGEITVSQDFVLVDIFNNTLTVDYLEKAEFTFESTNSINREFQLQIDFIDANDNTRYTLVLQAPQSANNAELVTEQIITFEGNSLIALKSTAKIQFTITLQSGPAITETTIGNIQLKSKGTFYFLINPTL